MPVKQRRPGSSAYAPTAAKSTKDGPAVSVCIPVFNGEAWIRHAIESALGQTYSALEVVIVDNASTDATLRRVQEIDDPRVRLYANARNLGIYRNFNRALSLAQGRYMQFLCSDDLLHPDCVASMVGVFESDPRVGLCFSARDIELEDPTDAAAVRWKNKHEHGHAGFGELQAVNSGEAMLETWVRDQLASNWIGEPTNVMMSRSCLRRVGTFPLRMHERGDMDLWARAMLFGSIGFVDRPLTSFRVRPGSLTSVNRETGQAWLDKLWMLEGLLTFDGVRRRHPAIARLRRRTLMRTGRNVLLRKRTPQEGMIGDLGRYLEFRLRRRGGRSKLYGTLDDRGDPGETVEVEGIAEAPSTAQHG
jgi:glycosyltransferase involved in cell wall biosynthesis